MKKILFMALLATTIFACSNENNEMTEETNLKSLDFSLDVASPKTRMSDDKVTEDITKVRAGITSITIEYFNAANASLGSYDFSSDEVDKAKSDNQEGTRAAVRIKEIPSATTKVNVYLNVNKSATNINDLQKSYTNMEYRGVPTSITLSKAGSERTDGGTNDLYTVEVEVSPVLSRFEFHGTAADFKINSSTDGTLPAGVTDGVLADVQGKVSAATISLAEKSAQAAWKAANPGKDAPEGGWTYQYTLKYKYDEAYTITSIDGYYMNNIPLASKDADLTLNANDGTGNWDATALNSYKAGGSMKNMFDTSVDAGKVIAYNLFPQTAKNNTSASVGDVKASMPHFILKLTTTNATAATRWLTIRALKTTDANALVTSFDAGKVYVLDAAQIEINQYSALLTVKANGTGGGEIPEPIDPTDPNPEPVGKDLDVLVKIIKWDIVNIKPEW